IGPSHSKAFAQAVAAEPEAFGDVQVFYATDKAFTGYRLDAAGVWAPAPMKAKRAARLREKSARFNDGAETVDAAAAERVLFVGAPNMAETIARLLDTHDVDGLRRQGARGALSSAAFETMLEEMAHASRLPADRRALSGPDVAAMLAPHPSSLFRRSPSRAFAARRRVAERPEGFAEALARYMALTREAYAADGIALIEQPAETLAETGAETGDATEGGAAATRPAFSAGGRDASGERERDLTQMNGDFGRACLRAWLRPDATASAAREPRDDPEAAAPDAA
ncbi:MAG: hypothetical protein AAFU61_16265, partial [Pseudomonadota bacterium]